LIATGRADAVIAGGADSLCDTTLFGFHSLGVLSERRCAPFDEGRSGINLGEGAAFFLLERGAKSTLELLGAGESADAHHLSSPHPEGIGARLAISRALDCSGLDPEQVDYINAHGTGTDLNDSTEAKAISTLFHQRVPVSSTKAATGHLLGACGATEAAVCLLALEDGKLPPNLLASRVDPTLDLEIVTTTREEKIRTALSNSLAFGGSNVTLAFARSDAGLSRNADASKHDGLEAGVQIVAAATWPPLSADGELLAHPSVPPATLLPARARGRASSLTRLFAEVIASVQGFANGDPAMLPIVYGSAAGEMETTLALLEHLVEGTSSPVRFQASVHNTAGGLISIATHNQTFSTAIAAGTETVAMALIEALGWLKAHGGETIVAVADEAAIPLINGKHYPAFAAAFLLRRIDGPREDSGLLLGDPYRVDTQSDGQKDDQSDDHSGSDNPCLPALALAQKARAHAVGPVSLTGAGDVKWQVDLQTS
jgi:3-oxoacyl-(acyl-carrier-protein) synthase